MVRGSRAAMGEAPRFRPPLDTRPRDFHRQRVDLDAPAALTPEPQLRAVSSSEIRHCFLAERLWCPSGECADAFRSEVVKAPLDSGEPPIHIAQKNIGSIRDH